MCIQADLWNTAAETVGAPCNISSSSLSIGLHKRWARKVAATLTHVTPVTSEIISVSNNNAVNGRLISSDTTLHTLCCITDRPVSSQLWR